MLLRMPQIILIQGKNEVLFGDAIRKYDCGPSSQECKMSILAA